MNDSSPPPVPADAALFLDFDGTLSPLQDKPDDVRLSAAMSASVMALHTALSGRVAIISGRHIADLASRVPRGLTRIGCHGLDVLSPDQNAAADVKSAPAVLVARLADYAAAHEGLKLEIKGEVLALHYRARPDAGDAALSEVTAAASLVAGYKVQPGKFVIEAKPRDADKGAALRRLMRDPPFAGARPVMVGDDATDEDAFAAALELGGVAIKVGEGQTRAPYRLADVGAVERWMLQGIAR